MARIRDVKRVANFGQRGRNLSGSTYVEFLRKGRLGHDQNLVLCRRKDGGRKVALPLRWDGRLVPWSLVMFFQRLLAVQRTIHVQDPRVIETTLARP